MLFKYRNDAKLYMISSYIQLISGLCCMIIAFGSVYTLISSKDMRHILNVAMMIPLFIGPLSSSLMAIKDDILFYQNKQYSFADLVIVEQDITFLGHKLILENRITNRKIVLFLSRNGAEMIESKILQRLY